MLTHRTPRIGLVCLLVAFAALAAPASAAGAPPSARDSLRAVRTAERARRDSVRAIERAAAETREAPAFTGVPLLLDRTDLALGTTVQYARIPSPAELHDLEYTYGLSRVVLSLPAWPRAFADIEPLAQRPADLELIVVLPGWPPTRESAEAWNKLAGPLRLVVLVSGPPPDRGVIDDLNAMRALERVIAQMDRPARSGFERLQRPLGFRRIVP